MGEQIKLNVGLNYKFKIWFIPAYSTRSPIHTHDERTMENSLIPEQESAASTSV